MITELPWLCQGLRWALGHSWAVLGSEGGLGSLLLVDDMGSAGKIRIGPGQTQLPFPE